MRRSHLLRSKRDGTTVVETAVVLPVFLTMLLGIFEFAHAQMVMNTLQSACRNGARIGSTEGTSTSQVIAGVHETLASAINTGSLSVFIKDASIYDQGGSPPTSGADVELLPDANLQDLEPRQLFVVRARVPYNSIAVVPMPFLAGVTLDGQAFMRHE